MSLKIYWLLAKTGQKADLYFGRQEGVCRPGRGTGSAGRPCTSQALGNQISSSWDLINLSSMYQSGAK